jgi:hypothetical protein
MTFTPKVAGPIVTVAEQWLFTETPHLQLQTADKVLALEVLRDTGFPRR